MAERIAKKGLEEVTPLRQLLGLTALPTTYYPSRPHTPTATPLLPHLTSPTHTRITIAITQKCGQGNAVLVSPSPPRVIDGGKAKHARTIFFPRVLLVNLPGYE